MVLRESPVPGSVWPRQLRPPVVPWITVENPPSARARAKQSALVGHETADGVTAARYAFSIDHRPGAGPPPGMAAAGVPAAPRRTAATAATMATGGHMHPRCTSGTECERGSPATRPVRGRVGPGR
jgi:hypothetical protein